VGLFDGVKRSIVSPVDANVDVPIIEKRNGQIISISNNTFQIMDLETFEVLETDLIDDGAKEKIRQGVQVEYWRVLGKSRIMRVKEA